MQIDACIRSGCVEFPAEGWLPRTDMTEPKRPTEAFDWEVCDIAPFHSRRFHWSVRRSCADADQRRNRSRAVNCWRSGVANGHRELGSLISACPGSSDKCLEARRGHLDSGQIGYSGSACNINGRRRWYWLAFPAYCLRSIGPKANAVSSRYDSCQIDDNPNRAARDSDYL